MNNEKNTMTRNEKFNQLINGAVFAQLQIQHSGDRYDRTVELFRCDRNGNQMTNFVDEFTVDGIIKIGKTIYSSMALEEGIGDLEDLVVELIFDGGAKAHFIIENDGTISEFSAGWSGWGTDEDLNIDEIIA